MPLSEPRQSHWNLRWRMFGIPIRVHPLFWASSALQGVIYYQDPAFGGLDLFAFWMVAVFVCVLLHEFGHVLAARIFGVRGGIVLAGLGGHMLGLEELKRRGHRVVVLLAGPLTSFLIVGVVSAVWALLNAAFSPVEARVWYGPVKTGVLILIWGNFWWGLLNVLPLWPLDGGGMAAEIGEGLFGRRGHSLTALLSIVTAGLLTIWVLAAAMWMQPELHNRFDIRYPLYLEYYAILVLFCFAFWLSGFRALWGEPEPPPSPKT